MSETAGESRGESERDEDHVDAEEASNFKSLPASVRKLKTQSCDSFEDCPREEEFEGLECFRLIAISVLASIFQLLRCPLCKHGHIVLEEDVNMTGFDRFRICYAN